jgi:MFS family permease
MSTPFISPPSSKEDFTISTISKEESSPNSTSRTPKQAFTISNSELTTTTPHKLTSFTRSPIFQILTLSFTAFCCPGIWSAISGLGLAGTSSPHLINSATSLLYAFMTITCFLSPFLTPSYLSFRTTLSLSSLGYPIYAAGLYVNSRHEGGGYEWVVYLGAIVCGIASGFFWAVEGAVATGVGGEKGGSHRGRYIATWNSLRYSAGILGGSISLAVNHNNHHKGKVTSATYLVFIGIQCLGFFFALFLSNPPQKQNSGTSSFAWGWKREAKEMWKLGRSKSILLLSPLFWYFGWSQAYPGTYLATYFSVRSRALASLMSAVVGILSTWLIGILLDLPWLSKNRSKRAKITYAIIAILNSALWIWGLILQNKYQRTKPVLDWTEQRSFAVGFGFYMLDRICLSMVENFIYWCISNLSDEQGELIRYSSLLRGIETAGVAIGFGVQAVPTVLIGTVGINFGLWFFAVGFGWVGAGRVVGVFEKRERERMGEEVSG